MNRLEQKHIDFLRKCAGNDKGTHVPDESIAGEDLQQMVKEGLLIGYPGLETRYAATQAGASVARGYGSVTEMDKIAVRYVMSKGYGEEAANLIVKREGAEVILKSKRFEENGEVEGQRQVKVPTNEMGKPEMKFYKP